MPMPVSLEAMKQIQSLEFDDWLVLVNPTREGLFLLNPMSRYIWEALLSGAGMSEITESLAEVFGRSQREVAADIEGAVQEWEATILSSECDNASEPVDPIEAAFDYGDAGTFDFRLYGHCFRLLISDRILQNEIEQRFSPFQETSQNFTPDFTFKLALTGLGYTITNAEGLTVTSDRSPGAARVDLINALIRICFPARKWLACIHAAALARGEQCVLLCAPSGGGKSTLAAAMMNSGFTLITDDLAYLDLQELKVSGLPLALLLRAGGWSALKPEFPELTDLPVGVRQGEPVRFLNPQFSQEAVSAYPGAIVFLNYHDEALSGLLPISSVDALVKIDQTNSWIDHSAGKLEVFLQWLQLVPKYQLTYSSAADAVKLASSVIDR